MKLKRATQSAWRGRYLYTNSGKQIARVTLDPKDGIAPTLTIALPVWWYRSCSGGSIHPRLWQVRIPMPRLRWRSNMGRIRLYVYKMLQTFWHKMDGRYGWGS